MDPKTILMFELQTHLHKVFFAQNTARSPDRLCLLLLARFRHLHKAQRTGEPAMIRFELPRVLAWLCAVASRFDVNLDQTLWDNFPGVCPYCRECPCDPTKHVKPKSRFDVSDIAREREVPTLREMQGVLRHIYPGNTLLDSVGHSVEEIAEIGDVVVYALEAPHSHFANAMKELAIESADLVAHLLAIANCAGLDMATLVVEAYNQGCSACGKVKCDCPWPDMRANSEKLMVA